MSLLASHFIDKESHMVTHHRKGDWYHRRMIAHIQKWLVSPKTCQPLFPDQQKIGRIISTIIPSLTHSYIYVFNPLILLCKVLVKQRYKVGTSGLLALLSVFTLLLVMLSANLAHIFGLSLASPKAEPETRIWGEEIYLRSEPGRLQ